MLGVRLEVGRYFIYFLVIRFCACFFGEGLREEGGKWCDLRGILCGVCYIIFFGKMGFKYY